MRRAHPSTVRRETREGLVHFVIGHPRSGTEFLAHVLNVEKILAFHEHLVGWRKETIRLATAFYEGLATREQIAACLDGYEQCARVHPVRVQVDCSWTLTWILPELIRRFPEARFVHLVRDPRQNVFSCWHLDYYGSLIDDPDFYPAHYWPRCDLRYWYSALPRIRRDDWDQLTPFERNCVFWTETHKVILDQLAGSDRVLRLRLEDLNVDKAAELFRFFGFGVPGTELLQSALQRRVNTKAYEKREFERLRGGALPLFDEADESMRVSLRRICGSTAAELGYVLGE
jgi:sulfotransferase family protein